MMKINNKKIFVTGAGSPQGNGVINCLLMTSDGEEVIGLGSDQYDLMMCKAHKKYLMPHSSDKKYKDSLIKALYTERPDMIHFQHDAELFVALKFKDEIDALGVKMLVPDFETIQTCVHKYESWKKFKNAGIKVPENLILEKREDLITAFECLADDKGFIWLRSASIGGGGKGSLPTNDIKEAEEWINKNNGWGNFIAAEILTDRTITFLSIWENGELIVAQSRKRNGWAYSSLSPSGITGLTKVGETCSDEIATQIAISSIKAVSQHPNGIYGVDMTYDKNNIPNPTEINISRFFTTIQFFAEAGLNMPKILKDIVLYGKRPVLASNINPLENDLLWIRSIDCLPLLTHQNNIENTLIKNWD